VKLAEHKDSNPIKMAEFSKTRGIANEPAFAWWVPHTLWRMNAILSAVKSRVRKKTHKYGIEVPTSLVRVKELDRINGNTLWMDALKLEMHNVGVAFEVLEDGKGAPQGWTKTGGHYQIELAEFAKARGIADEPAFAWWVPHTLSRRKAILSAVKARVRKKTQKYGIEVPTSLVLPRSWTESVFSSWRCTMLELPLRSLRIAKEHHRDGRRQVATLCGT
jgi:hypothetical protein